MKKWKNRKIRDFLAHRFTGIFYLQAIECNLHGNSSCCTGRRPDECFVATPPLLLLTPNSIRIYQGLFLLYNFYPRTQPCTDKIPGSSRLYTGHNQCFECSFFRLVLCVNVNSDCGTFHVLTSFQKSITLLVPNKPLFLLFLFLFTQQRFQKRNPTSQQPSLERSKSSRKTLRKMTRRMKYTNNGCQRRMFLTGSSFGCFLSQLSSLLQLCLLRIQGDLKLRYH